MAPMNRASFLRRAGLALGALSIGARVPVGAAESVPAAPEALGPVVGYSGDLVASGGLCAPVSPYYTLAYFENGSKPLRDALPAFHADRGGIRYRTPPGLGTLADRQAADELALRRNRKRRAA